MPSDYTNIVRQLIASYKKYDTQVRGLRLYEHPDIDVIVSEHFKKRRYTKLLEATAISKGTFISIIVCHTKLIIFIKIRFLGGKLGNAIAKEYDASTVRDLL